MKYLFSFLFAISTLLGNNNDFLPPEEAFKTSILKERDNITLKINLSKNIYLYDEQLKVIVLQGDKKIDITSKIKFPKPEIYDGFKVHFDDLNMIVPRSLLGKVTNSNNAKIDFKFQGCSKAGLCYQPMNQMVEYKTLISDYVSDKISESDSITISLKNENFLWVLFTFFGFGLLLSLTPCVFPMVPILSGIIISHSKNGQKMNAKKGLYLSVVYILSMSIAYTIAGVLAGLFGANLQVALQNPYVITIFSGVFVVLALSMFGYFSLELPQSWQNKINSISKQKEGHNSITGVGIMGFLSALIVGPCVAPPLAGALVYIGQSGDALLGGSALFAMSIGMGFPLLIVGIGAGKYMPKPGGWMNTISKIFGIIMLGVAIWMLERVVYIEIIFALWSLLFILSGVYFFKNNKNKFAKFISVLTIVVGIFYVAGLFTKSKDVLNPLENIIGEIKTKLPFQTIKTLNELNNIINTSDKPIMIDFYADWCISCKELEHKTFSDKEVQKKLKNFTLLQIDTTHNTNDDKELLKKFNLFGPPGIIFFKNKKELKNITIIGYKSPKDFLNIISQEFN